MAIDPDIIRTIIGEAGTDPDSVRAVASVFKNRQASTKKDYGTLAQEGFEARQDPQTWAKLSQITPQDAQYQKALQAALPILDGNQDPVGTYTHYYSPTGQAAKGRPPPAWAKGQTGTSIGGNLFFTEPAMAASDTNPPPSLSDQIKLAKSQGHSDDDIYKYLSTSPAYADKVKDAQSQGYTPKDVLDHLGLKPTNYPTSQPNSVSVDNEYDDPTWYSKLGPTSHVYYDKEGKSPVTDEQQSTYEKLAKAGIMDLRQPMGSKASPQPIPSDDTPIDPRWYVIRPNGDLIAPKDQQPGMLESAGQGFKTGLTDVKSVLESGLSNVMYGTMAIPDWLKQDQDKTKQQQAEYAASPEAFTTAGQFGHFAGQQTPALPLTVIGGEAAGLAAKGAEEIPVLGNALKFAAGKAGAPLSADSGVTAKISNALVRAGSQSTAGAALGASDAALTGGDPTTGALAGAAFPIAGAAGGYLGDVASGLAKPLSKTGQRDIAESVVRKFAQGGPTDINTNALIPGVSPTTAQATGNAGLASLERSLRAVPEVNNMLEGRAAQNAAARTSATEGVAGTPDTLEAAIANRSVTTDALRDKAFAGAPKNVLTSPTPTLDTARALLGPEASDDDVQWAANLMPKGELPAPKVVGNSDPSNAIAAIDQMLEGPTGQRQAVAASLKSVRDRLVQDDPITKQPVYETDPAQLYGIRQHADDLLSPLAKGEGGGPLSAKQLTAVKQELDKAIEQGAPGYKDYLDTYSSMSKPIDQQKFLQGLNLTNSNGEITLSKADAAVKKAETLRGAKGAQDAKSLSEGQMQFLYDLRDDLRREANSSTGVGRMGSSTVQNAASGYLMNKLGAGAPALKAIQGVPLVGPALHTMLGAGYDKANEAVLGHLTDMMLNPTTSGVHAALSPEQNSLITGLLKNKIAGRLGTAMYPAITAATSNALAPSQ